MGISSSNQLPGPSILIDNVLADNVCKSATNEHTGSSLFFDNVQDTVIVKTRLGDGVVSQPTRDYVARKRSGVFIKIQPDANGMHQIVNDQSAFATDNAKAIRNLLRIDQSIPQLKTMMENKTTHELDYQGQQYVIIKSDAGFNIVTKEQQDKNRLDDGLFIPRSNNDPIILCTSHVYIDVLEAALAPPIVAETTIPNVTEPTIVEDFPIDEEELKWTAETLQASYKGVGQPRTFWHNHTPYLMWYTTTSTNTHIINIQPRANFYSDNAGFSRTQTAPSQNKIGIQLSLEGKPLSFRESGQPVASLTDVQIELLKKASSVAIDEMKLKEIHAEGGKFIFSETEMRLLKLLSQQYTATSPYEFSITENQAEVKYKFWYNPTYKSFIIQKLEDWRLAQHTNKYSIGIDNEGKIISYYKDNAPVGNPPHEKAPELFKLFNHAFSKVVNESETIYSSTHNNKVKVTAYRDGLFKTAGMHLHRLVDAIQSKIATHQRYDLYVTFLKEDGTEETGLDYGGLKRFFVSTLIGSITANSTPEMKFKLRGGNARPITSARYNIAHPENPPLLTPIEYENFLKLGTLLGHCFNSDSTKSGAYFSPSVFAVMAKMSNDLLDKNYDALTEQEILQLGKEIAIADRDTVLQGKYEVLAMQTHNLTKAQVKKAFLAAGGDVEPYEWEDCQANETTTPSNKILIEGVVYDKLKLTSTENWKRIINEVKVDILTNIGQEVAPIHAIAAGFRKALNPSLPLAKTEWNNKIYNKVPKTIADQTMGTIDRQVIVTSFRQATYDQPITTKVAWLKEWILDPQTSEEEIKKFLSFVTGTASFRPGDRITIQRYAHPPYSPLAKSHTCFSSMELSPIHCGPASGVNDHTKEAFINALKLAMSEESFED